MLKWFGILTILIIGALIGEKTPADWQYSLGFLVAMTCDMWSAFASKNKEINS